MKIGKLARSWAYTQIMGKLLKTKIFSANEKEIREIILTIGELKGGMLKSLQFLALYAEDFLPPVIAEALPVLYNQNPTLAWKKIAPSLAEKTSKLHILQEPIAAASIGQVYLANLEEEKFVLKLRYPDIESIIKADLKIIEILLRFIPFIPSNFPKERFIQEVEKMLLQETNYLKEVELIKKYSEKASGQYIIPKVYERYSSESCLCLEYIEGKKLGEVELSLDERNKLTQEFFELFLDEIFKWGLMQTDAHHGNYLLVKKDESYIWALLDFGATKIISQEQQQSYSLFLNSIVDQEPDIFFEELEKNISLNEEVKEKLWKHVCLVLEPLLKDEYNFKTSELPKRIIQSGIKMIGDIKVHEYPIENIFIDRKIAGVYSILRELDPSVSLRTLYFDWKEQCSQ